MKYEKVKVDKIYKINYKGSAERFKLWRQGLLPKPGTRVKVTDKRGKHERLPIGIKDVKTGKSYLCKPEDLIPVSWRKK